MQVVATPGVGFVSLGVKRGEKLPRLGLMAAVAVKLVCTRLPVYPSPRCDVIPCKERKNPLLQFHELYTVNLECCTTAANYAIYQTPRQPFSSTVTGPTLAR